MKRPITILFAMAAAAPAVACASSPPPRELLDARAAYARVSVGDAPKLEPGAMHAARMALAAAEASYDDRASTYVTRDRAYVAYRKAELADVLASTSRIKMATAEATARAEGERSRGTNDSLRAMDDARERLSLIDGQLQSKVDRIVAEEERKRAEAKAREALEKLSAASAVWVRDEPRGTVITVPAAVLFASGEADLLPSAGRHLEPVAEVLSQERDHRIRIEGHMDSMGSDGLSKTLSQRRADSVRDFLVSHRVPSDQVTATGVGRNKPVSNNGTAEGRATNRRVEIVVEPTSNE